MSCISISIGNGILCMANIDFVCPECHKMYSDSNDKYLNRCNKNMNNCTLIKCSSCGQPFYMTYNYKGNAVSFLPLNQSVKQNEYNK